ncbi:MAG TPA: hypothetical protein VF046_15355, partial [Gemmatimonadales bacterium]
GTDIALLSAVDDPDVSTTGDRHPVYNLLRLQRDIGAQSRVGLVYTDRVEGGDYNRVAGGDARLVFREVYSAQLQLAASRTRLNGSASTAPLWLARMVRNGRTFGFRTILSGSHPEFRAQSGFLPRVGYNRINLDPRLTLYGTPGSLIESFTGDLNLDGLYRYGRLLEGEGMQEEKVHLNANLRLRGGWQAGASVLVEQFGYPAEVYEGYRIELPRLGGGADTVAFTGRARIPNRDYVLQLDTPEFAQFSASVFALWGHDENYYEWASGDLTVLNAGLDWRPTDQLRLNGSYQLQRVGRRTDGSTVNIQHIPRLKVEYQLSRPIFFRLVGEYASERQDALRDHTRTEAPILIFDADAGDFVRTTPFRTRSLRGDLLFSYQPGPGTVLFAGYGSTLREPVEEDERVRTGMRRVEDGFFLKLSYLLRM